MSSIGNLDNLQKRRIVECLEKRDFAALEDLECFKDFSSINGSTAKKLLEKIYFNFDEDDLDTQEKFYLFLDRIIDGICQVRFKRQSRGWEFSDVNQINNEVLKYFKGINYEAITNQEILKNILKNLTNKLIREIASDSSYWDECYKNITDLFEDYRINGMISEAKSSDFYNELLNRQRNYFINLERNKIISQLTNILPYTKRKENSRIIGAKLKKFDLLLSEHKYDEIGISKNDLAERLINFASYLSSLKEIKKDGVLISDFQCKLLNEKFLNGSLTIEDIESICPEISLKGASIIFDKYTQIKMKCLSNIEVSDEELPSLDLGYNYNNYKIVCRNFYHENLAKLLLKLADKNGRKLLEESENNKYIFLLVFFIDYFNDFDVNDVVPILKNYSRILRDFGTIINDKEVFGLSFDKLLTLGKAYNHADDLTIGVLGTDIVERVVMDGITSKDPQDYVDVYLKMLGRDKVYIPPVSGEYKNCYYESAYDVDCERLMIGKNCSGSCIGIDGAGEEAYLSCLTGLESDVIVFKDKTTNEFLARSLCFRKGNFVVMAPIYGKNGIVENLYNPELLSNIASQMINKATNSGDNLEYVFMTSNSVPLKEYFQVFDNMCLWDGFPHADLYPDKYLIGSKNSNTKVELRPDDAMLASYDTKREKVKVNDDVTDTDINKIRILDILFLEDRYLREEKARYFEFIDKDNFDDVYLGQDWYVAVKDGKIVDKKILPVSNERQENELLNLYKHLCETGIIEDVFDEMYSSNYRRR